MEEISASRQNGSIMPAAPIPAGVVQIIFNGENYHCYFPGDEMPAPIEQTFAPPPRWRDFRLAMLQSLPFTRLAAAVDAQDFRLQSRLEAAISQTEPHIPTVAAFWRQATEIFPLTESEISTFQQLATLHNIPLQFDPKNGQIKL